jgi:heavy metal sensor kinase
VRARWPAASIRARLTGWYTAVLSLMLMVYASVTFVAVRHEFMERFDDQLHEDFETAEGSLARAADGRIMWTGERHHDGDAEHDVAYDVWSATGQQLHRSGASVALPSVSASPARGDYRYQSMTVSGVRWRTLTATHSVDGLPVVLRVARSEDKLRAQLREILLVLLLGFPLAVALAGFGGYILARRALRPIDHLASEARRITAERLHDRLTVPNQHDEIGRLAGVINNTFARLESSFEQLRRFTADASHELRTPLAVIRGIGEVGLSESRTADEHKETIGSMLEEVDRLTNLVDTLLRLSHGDAGTIRVIREHLDLGQLTSDVVSSLGILAEEREQSLRLMPFEATSVSVDRLVLREAITNVVDNAIKYSPTKSTIEIRVQAIGDEAALTVADEGPGIPPEQRDRIFDRFFRLDEGRSRDHGGTGLGLSIAKWAVEINRGNITVEQRPGGGSIFRMTLPLSRASTISEEATHHRIGG